MGTFGGEFGARNQWGLYGVCVRQRRDIADNLLWANLSFTSCVVKLSQDARTGNNQSQIKLVSKEYKLQIA